jgi:hypothetical protein
MLVIFAIASGTTLAPTPNASLHLSCAYQYRYFYAFVSEWRLRKYLTYQRLEWQSGLVAYGQECYVGVCVSVYEIEMKGQ